MSWFRWGLTSGMLGNWGFGFRLSGRMGSQAEEGVASPMAASEGEEGGEGDTLIEELKTEVSGNRYLFFLQTDFIQTNS